MRVTYDERADKAYIGFTREASRVQDTYGLERRLNEGVTITLNFGFDDRLVGIEVLEASKSLPPELLEEAEKIG